MGEQFDINGAAARITSERGREAVAKTIHRLIDAGAVPTPEAAKGPRGGRPAYVFDVSYAAAVALILALHDAGAVTVRESASVWRFLAEADDGPAAVDVLLAETSARRPSWLIVTRSPGALPKIAVRLCDDEAGPEVPHTSVPAHRVLAPFVSIPAEVIR